jgi:hypothetical protein
MMRKIPSALERGFLFAFFVPVFEIEAKNALIFDFIRVLSIGILQFKEYAFKTFVALYLFH